MKVADLRGLRVYLDTNIFIYAVEGQNRFTGVLTQLFSAIDAGELVAVTSEVTFAEVLTKPCALGALSVIDSYTRMLDPSGPIDVLAVTRPVADLAARIRAATGIKLVDAMHLATAGSGGCQYFLSHDRRLATAVPAGTDWLALDDVVGA